MCGSSIAAFLFSSWTRMIIIRSGGRTLGLRHHLPSRFLKEIMFPSLAFLHIFRISRNHFSIDLSNKVSGFEPWQYTCIAMYTNLSRDYMTDSISRYSNIRWAFPVIGDEDVNGPIKSLNKSFHPHSKKIQRTDPNDKLIVRLLPVLERNATPMTPWYPPSESSEPFLAVESLDYSPRSRIKKISRH